MGQSLVSEAVSKGKLNVAFLSLFLLRRPNECVRLLRDGGRAPEAAFMARTYAPASVSEAVANWKMDLATVNRKAAEALADPTKYPNLFPNFDWALRAEARVAAGAEDGVATLGDADTFLQVEDELCSADPVAEEKRLSSLNNELGHDDKEENWSTEDTAALMVEEQAASPRNAPFPMDPPITTEDTSDPEKAPKVENLA